MKNKVFLFWIPGHSGIKGNEEANTLAEEGAGMSLIGSEPFCGIGECTYKKKFLEKENSEREKLCEGGCIRRQTVALVWKHSEDLIKVPINHDLI